MTLLEKCQALQEKRLEMVRLENSAKETSALQTHASLLEESLRGLSRVVKSRGDLISENIEVDGFDLQKVKEVTKALLKIRGRFAKNPNRQALVADDDWPILSKGLKALTPSIEFSCKKSWKNYSDGLFAKTLIVESQVVKTEHNTAQLEAYRVSQRKLKFLATDWENIESVRSFKVEGEKLVALAKELSEFQAPEDVKRFLDAISSKGSASLDLLTENVISWLKEQKIYTNYKIIGVG